MTNIDQAFVEALRDATWYDDRPVGVVNASQAERIIAAAVDAARAEAWDEGYATCLGDFDIAARREARSPNPHKATP